MGEGGGGGGGGAFRVSIWVMHCVGDMVQCWG